MSKKKRTQVLYTPLIALILFWVGAQILPLLALESTPVSTTAGQILMQKAPAESGSANAVTGIVVWFRGLDTLGEVTVLFLAASGVGLLLGAAPLVQRPKVNEVGPSIILQTAAQWLLPVLLLFGVYIIAHGHLSPGGGFQGGVVMASAVILLVLAGIQAPGLSILHIGEGLAGASYSLLALSGIWFGLGFLGNWLPHSQDLLGLLLSAGIIPLLYVAIGLKVGAELSALGRYLTTEESH